MKLTLRETEELESARQDLEKSLTAAYMKLEPHLAPRLPREAFSIEFCKNSAEATQGVRSEARFIVVKAAIWAIMGKDPLCQQAEATLKQFCQRIWPRLKVDSRKVYLGRMAPPPTPGQQLAIRLFQPVDHSRFTTNDRRFLKSLRISADEGASENHQPGGHNHD